MIKLATSVLLTYSTVALNISSDLTSQTTIDAAAAIEDDDI